MSTPVDSRAFRAWFGRSRVVDRRGRPRVVYHGTTHPFTVFDPDRANIENDWGKAIYFTSDRRDASINYAGIGPDLKQRIEGLAEQLDMERAGGIRIALAGDLHEESVRKATERLAGTAPVIIPCYLSLQNPVIIGGPHETILDYEYGPTEDDIQHFMPLAREDDPDASEEEVRQKAWDMAVENNYESERGTLARFFENLARVASNYENTDLGQIEELKGDFYGHEHVPASKLREGLKKYEGLAYATDEESNLASHEIIREAFERTGFDGVIDYTARQRFGLRESQDVWTGRRKKYGMHGMYPGTVHYAAFRPEQVKSIWNRGTWDPRDPDIRRNPW